jgi:chromosome segregation ATPase
MSNDEWEIVPERDEAISSRARQTKSGDSRRDKTTRTTKPESSSSKASGLLIFLLLVSFAASGYLYYQLQLSDTIQQDLTARIVDMEGKLSVTDESLSESGAAMQAVLRDHDVKIDTNLSEIRKLWGVAYDTNRKAIDELRANSSTIASNLSGAVDRLDEIDGRFDGLGSQMLIQAADVEDLLTRLRLTRDELNQQATLLNQLEAQSTDQLDAIDSIDSFRLQMNQKVIQLENEIRSLSVGTIPQP